MLREPGDPLRERRGSPALPGPGHPARRRGAGQRLAVDGHGARGRGIAAISATKECVRDGALGILDRSSKYHRF